MRSYYPIVGYLKPTDPKTSPWEVKHTELSMQAYEELPVADVISIESINDFIGCSPIEIAAPVVPK